jgi:hypothetical protein
VSRRAIFAFSAPIVTYACANVFSPGHEKERLMSFNAIPLPVLLGTMGLLAVVMVYFIVARKFGKKK